MMQVELKRGNTHQISWIPHTEAFLGRIVDLKEGNTWDLGWKVVNIYPGATFEYEYIAERSRDYTRTRKASDI